MLNEKDIAIKNLGIVIADLQDYINDLRDSRDYFEKRYYETLQRLEYYNGKIKVIKYSYDEKGKRKTTSYDLYDIEDYINLYKEGKLNG